MLYLLLEDESYFLFELGYQLAYDRFDFTHLLNKDAGRKAGRGRDFQVKPIWTNILQHFHLWWS
jgi:hypothetical protein